VTAVGDPKGMRQALARDPQVAAFAGHAERYELGFEVERPEEISVPGGGADAVAAGGSADDGQRAPTMRQPTALCPRR
jgi:hypothetical protein